MKITGHRGAKDEWPENTLLGMRKAIESGVEALEIDVHVTKDNKLVVIHDSTMDRTTNIEGEIANLLYDDIQLADAGMGERVPTLAEVLDLVLESEVELFIEAKVFGIKNKLLELLKEKSVFEQVIIISFDHRFIKSIADENPSLRTGCLMVAAPVDPVSIIKATKSECFVISTDTVDVEIVKQCHSAGIKVAVWNANTPLIFQQMREMNVDYIMTDRPSLICPLVTLNS